MFDINLATRLLKFFIFIKTKNFEGSISLFENEFHVYISKDGKIYSSGQNKSLTHSLNEALKGLENVGLS